MFKRRDKRPFWRIAASIVYPRGGWARAFEYVKHRVRRLPDTPEKISRGIAAGVFTTFTPFYGFHFFIAAFLARTMRGNIIASLLATFFGNPLTYVPIAATSLGTGYFLLGMRPDAELHQSLGKTFAGAGRDLWQNFTSLFTPEKADWHRLHVFYDEVFFPYMIGGILPGLIMGAIAYYLSVPVIAAYQNRRRKLLRAKLEQLGKKNGLTDDD
ncbi:DUF2062 domain-containing protein [Yoonia sp.]|uniref:DUF2062 domain-containing protein n=1 Tax=Yoonia sp. TaxID=2212373 RepID=UPI0019E05B3D|nr:DUF2062 domain-containing protein [Yoonia sp.]MBE0413375.1 DUF2062 domain-containing protein [Yoonia sp.]